MRFKAAACLALLLSPAALPAGETVAVLSSGSGAYLEAFAAFEKAYGKEVPRYDAGALPPELPRGTKTVVTFGARAAALRYPGRLNLVYALAPGFFLDPAARTGSTVKISMRPSPERTLARFLELQPALRRLRIFWSSPGYASLGDNYGAAGAALGIEVTAVKVERPERLPALLRKALGHMDALWLPPDPLLLSPETLLIFREFSRGNQVPMYAATKGITRDGACASLGISFAQAGAAAGDAAKGLQDGARQPPLVYPEVAELTINASAARQCGLKFSPALLRQADHLIP